MRVGPIIVGSILLLVGLLSAAAGGAMRDVADICMRASDCDNDLAFTLFLGGPLLYGGMMLALAGLGILVAGILAQPPAREGKTIPVEAADARACPACGEMGPAKARYCASCGAAVARTLAP